MRTPALFVKATVMNEYNWAARVRVIRNKDGWVSQIIDTPIFELRSNAQFGSVISSRDQAEKMVFDMYAPLLTENDTVYIDVWSAD